MNEQANAALRAIGDHYQNDSRIPTEDDIAGWLNVRPSRAVEVINELGRGGYIEVRDGAQVSGFGRQAERAIWGLTRRGEDLLAEAGGG